VIANPAGMPTFVLLDGKAASISAPSPVVAYPPLPHISLFLRAIMKSAAAAGAVIAAPTVIASTAAG